MNKLKGFTVIELVVVLIISGILFILITNVYSNFNKYFQRSVLNQKASNEFLWLATRLKDDMINSEYIAGSNDNINLYFKDRKVTYEFFDDRIVYSNGTVTESIKMNISNIEIGKIKEGIINYLSFSYDYKGQVFAFCQNKTYSNRSLFNLTENK